jgi:hypothetical protein
MARPVELDFDFDFVHANQTCIVDFDLVQIHSDLSVSSKGCPCVGVRNDGLESPSFCLSHAC